MKGKTGLERALKALAFCNEHGHIFNKKTESGEYGSNIVYGACSRCKLSYERPLSQEELAQRSRRMNSPFTI